MKRDMFAPDRQSGNTSQMLEPALAKDLGFQQAENEETFQAQEQGEEETVGPVAGTSLGRSAACS